VANENDLFFARIFAQYMANALDIGKLCADAQRLI
jgi:hypothetical protein